jgi:hypothetical protein
MPKDRNPHKFIAFFFIILLLAAPCRAEEETTMTPRALRPGLEHLLDLARHDSHSLPDMALIDRVVDYVMTPKDPAATYSAGQRNGATSNYFEFTIDRSLEDVINLAFNPAIPSYFVLPASLHQSRWMEVDGKQQPFPDLSKGLNTLDKPIFVRGVEFMENTPDTFSGAYYSYLLDRAVILARYKGHRVLLSMSTQREKSDVGKKGLVLGNDDDWNYIYTGEKGCTRTGLGWVDSYMYNSESIMVYYEVNEPVPHVRCGIFKWVDAGWAGINMAQTHHIKSGVERFVKTFKEVVESPNLPQPSKLADMLGRIAKLPTQILQDEVQCYFAALRSAHQNDNRLCRKWFAQLFQNNRYVNGMNREALKAVVSKEYLKYLLGKSPGFDIAIFEKAKTCAQNPEQTLAAQKQS